MKEKRSRNLVNVFESEAKRWDHDGTRRWAREQFRSAIVCGTRHAGGEVFVSESGEKLVLFHTCKSRACPSCGFFQSLRWTEEMASTFPAVEFTRIILTMRGWVWNLFRQNRHLIPSVPALAANVLLDWAREKADAEVGVITVLHTFGAKLNFNIHVHAMTTRVGVSLWNGGLVSNIDFNGKQITKRWQEYVLDFLIGIIDKNGLT
jgi:hypothetical protein